MEEKCKKQQKKNKQRQKGGSEWNRSYSESVRAK